MGKKKGYVYETDRSLVRSAVNPLINSCGEEQTNVDPVSPVSHIYTTDGDENASREGVLKKWEGRSNGVRLDKNNHHEEEDKENSGATAADPVSAANSDENENCNRREVALEELRERTKRASRAAILRFLDINRTRNARYLPPLDEEIQRGIKEYEGYCRVDDGGMGYLTQNNKSHQNRETHNNRITTDHSESDIRQEEVPKEWGIRSNKKQDHEEEDKENRVVRVQYVTVTKITRRSSCTIS